MTTALHLRDEFPVPSFDQWRETATADLKGADFAKKLVWRTLEGFDVQPLHVRGDVADLASARTLPGEFPFVRGTRPAAAGGSWTIHQECQGRTPQELNAAMRDGLARGQTGICIGNGIVNSLADLRIALAGIDWAGMPLMLGSGGHPLAMLAALAALADEQGVARAELKGCLDADPLGRLAAQGTLPFSPERAFDTLTAMARWCVREMPGVRPLRIAAHVYHEAGASLAQELGIAIESGTECAREMVARGMAVDDAARCVAFDFPVSTNVLLEIAKLRAARMMWAKAMADEGATDASAMKMVLHARSSRRTKTAMDGHCNLIRSSLEGFAAVVGGCDSLRLAPFDEPFADADEFGVHLARNQQVLLEREAYLDKVADPAGGSFLIEKLTESMAIAARDFARALAADGGVAATLQAGSLQKRIAEVAAKKRAMTAGRQIPVVGASNYADASQAVPEPRKASVAPAAPKAARALRHAGVDADPVAFAIEAACAGASFPEITVAVAPANDSSRPQATPLATERASEPYERLRLRAAAQPRQPSVVLVTTGPAAMRRARADFSSGFFQAGGFLVHEIEATDDVDEAVRRALATDAAIAVACSDDESYPKIVPALSAKLKAARPKMLVCVAGPPIEGIASAVDEFVHIRANVVETLGRLQDKLGFAARTGK